MKNTSTLFTTPVLVLLCACTPDSNNIGETLTTGSSTGASTDAQTDPTTGEVTDGATDPTSSTGTTAVDSTGALDTTTGSTGDSSTSDPTTGDASDTSDTSDTGDTTTTGDTTNDTDDTGGAVFPCGMKTCDATTQYCSVFVPGVMDAEIQYSCAQIPARCDDTPSCACLPDGEAPPCQCAEDQGFTVTCYGA